MVKGSDVLAMLRPEGGWLIRGNEYSGIEWVDCEPLSEEEFNAGFAEYNAWKAEQEATAQAKKQALLDRLGITEEEAKLLLGL